MIPSPNRVLIKDGKLENNSGTTVVPSPKEMEIAMINKLFWFVKSTVVSILIPDDTIIPNMTTVAPPKTAVGINVASAAILGTSPKCMLCYKI